MLEMESFQHALVGEVGEGLNVEQRKRLTIGVELAAKPALLLFADEPTSGESPLRVEMLAATIWLTSTSPQVWTRKVPGLSSNSFANSQITVKLFCVRSINLRANSSKFSIDSFY
jgi:hypothetical protein